MLSALLVGVISGDAMLASLVKSSESLNSAAAFVTEGTNRIAPIKVLFAPTGGRVSLPNLTIVESNTSGMRFYDELFGQVASTPTRTPGHPEKDLISASIVNRAAMAFLIDGDVRRQFLGDLKKMKGWKLKGQQLSNGQKGKSATILEFDAKNRITKVNVTVGKKTLVDYRYKFVEPTAIPTIPATAKVRQGLPQRPEIPSTTPPPIVLSCQSIWKAMSRLDGSKILQNSETGSFETVFKSGGLSESGGKSSWTFKNGQLTVGTQNFKVSPVKAIDHLAKSGVQTSSISRYLLNLQIPYLDLFNRPTKISDGGSISTGGVMCKILNIDRGSVRIRMFADKKTNRIVLLSSESLDPKGSRITVSRMKLSYL